MKKITQLIKGKVSESLQERKILHTFNKFIKQKEDEIETNKLKIDEITIKICDSDADPNKLIVEIVELLTSIKYTEEHVIPVIIEYINQLKSEQ